MPAAPTHPVDVFLVLSAGEQVLLALRQGTGYADGCWNLPSGKLELGEDVASAMIREAREEIGLRLDRADPRLVATIHYRPASERARLALVFAVAYDPHRHGEPVNAEPAKCGGIAWYRPDDLPAQTDRYTVECLATVRDAQPLRLCGWDATGDR